MAKASPQWQGPILNDLWEALVGVLPEDWDSAVMELTPTDRGFGLGLSHSISGPTGSRGLAIPDDAVFEACRRLELGLVERNQAFKRALVQVSHDGDVWRCKIDYEY